VTVLVTGGAGYIGSHTVAEFLAFGEDVVVVDRQLHRSAVPAQVPFYQVDIHDEDALRDILRSDHVDTVVHFAAYSLVGESVHNPLKYYRNNVSGTERLLSAMVAEGVHRIVFSSTAAVYGEPTATPIVESMPTIPTNPYGETKLAIERMFHWAHQAYGLQSISLRYFNAAGAHKDGVIGEDHRPETHLIPIVLQAALGQRDAVSIYGDDYDTSDGTCIRDYIHVMDLASAHRLAVRRLRAGQGSVESFNLGSGRGFSVNEVIETARKVTGIDIPAKVTARRAGDPAILVASSDAAQSALGWKLERPDLEQMVESAWRWHQSHPHGYED
jgi:UDP-glucose 4-epimerase